MSSWITSLVWIDSTGYHFSDYPAFLAALTAQYQAIYGTDVYIEPDSQDGQFIAILAQSFYDTAALGASVYNSFSPSTAQGVGLSRVVKINGLSRLVPSYSTVTLTIGGTAGTVITNGVASDILGQQWVLPATVTIPLSGIINVTATAQNVGAVYADAGTITTLYTPTIGWQTVTNALAATPGAAVESDAALRIRQTLSTSLPAQTVFDATIGAVANVTGVTKVKGYENQTGLTDSISMPAHSINITAVGGSQTDICNAIVAQKTPGTNTVGKAGPFLCYDAKGMPLNIYYSVAVSAEIQVDVYVTPLQGWSTNYVSQIQQSVAAYINALPIGSSLLYSALFVPASLIGTPAFGTFSVTDIQMGLNGGGLSHSLITLNQGLQGTGAQNPTCNPASTGDVTVTVA
jgi:uncharacterized phage protein gp47/JayE